MLFPFGLPVRKRPLVLTVALCFAWMFGVGGFLDGCSSLSYFGSSVVDTSKTVPDTVQNREERAILQTLGEEFLAATDKARSRMLPCGIASFLLGGAMILLSARAFRGDASVRNPLLQLVCVQALLLIVLYALTPDVRHAEQRYLLARTASTLRSFLPNDPTLAGPVWDHPPLATRLAPLIYLLVRSSLSCFVAITLMHPHTLAWFRGKPLPTQVG